MSGLRLRGAIQRIAVAALVFAVAACGSAQAPTGTLKNRSSVVITPNGKTRCEVHFAFADLVDPNLSSKRGFRFLRAGLSQPVTQELAECVEGPIVAARISFDGIVIGDVTFPKPPADMGRFIYVRLSGRQEDFDAVFSNRATAPVPPYDDVAALAMCSKVMLTNPELTEIGFAQITDGPDEWPHQVIGGEKKYFFPPPTWITDSVLVATCPMRGPGFTQHQAYDFYIVDIDGHVVRSPLL